MNTPDLNDYLRLFNQYTDGDAAFVASGDMRLLFAQMMAMINRSSRFNRELPLPILLVAHQERCGEMVVSQHFRSSENQCFFLNDLYRYVDMKDYAETRHCQHESRESGNATWLA